MGTYCTTHGGYYTSNVHAFKLHSSAVECGVRCYTAKCCGVGRARVGQINYLIICKSFDFSHIVVPFDKSNVTKLI